MYLTTLHKYLENNCNIYYGRGLFLGKTGSCLLNIPRSAWDMCVRRAEVCESLVTSCFILLFIFYINLPDLCNLSIFV